MLKLIEVNEENWLELRRLSVSEAQKGFLDSPVGILARGYVYRHDRARVIGIEDDDTVIGVALVLDLALKRFPKLMMRMTAKCPLC